MFCFLYYLTQRGLVCEMRTFTKPGPSGKSEGKFQANDNIGRTMELSKTDIYCNKNVHEGFQNNIAK